jgi:hypothetical protein
MSIEAMRFDPLGASPMTRTARLSSLVLSALLCAPLAYAMLAQAAQITA